MTSHDPTSGRLTARADEVHVWRVSLNEPVARVNSLHRLLADDELRRMDRFRFDIHRRRFCVGRGTLRRLLGLYLGVGPETIVLAYGPRGKPRLDRAGAACPDLRFNVSHSADEALVAVVLGRELGVDIERVKPGVDAARIARRFFSSDEIRRLLGMPEEQRTEAFFDCWTRKESFIKACGDGLQLPLDGFDVTFGPGTPARLLRVEWDASEAERWEMAALKVAAGFRGAITVEGRGWELRQMDAGEAGRGSTARSSDERG